MKFAAAISLGLAALFTTAELGAQGVRVTGVSNVQLIQLRPLRRDSVLATSTTGTDEWRTRADGSVVHCGSGAYCYWYRSDAIVSAAPFLQDLSFSSWGIAEGVSVHADIRARTQLAGQGLVYPRADDHLDVLDAYAELERRWGRARLGRQWVAGGLGSYDFDGASALVRRQRWTFEGWGGRALVAGLYDGYASASLAAVENKPPDQDGWILGTRVRMRTTGGTSAAATYQRILVADRSGVYAERAAFDAVTRVSDLTLDAALAYDFATGAWNEARLRVATSRTRAFGVSAEVRHSVPFFELWTIWGAFSPVGFNEARATVDWRSAAGPLSASVHGAYRKYEEAKGGFELRNNGWRAGGNLSWSDKGPVSAMASYNVDIGNGASRNDARATVRWSRDDNFAAGFDVSAMQTIYEFSVGTGRVFGFAFDLSRRLASDLRLSADAGLYRHVQTLGAPGPDWTQQRASLRLEWSLGRDPGAPAAPAAPSVRR